MAIKEKVPAQQASGDISFLRNMRRNIRGAVGASGEEQAPQAEQNISTVKNVQIVAKPATSNLVRGAIYIPVGADLLVSNTKSIFVQGVEYVLNSVAPYYFQGVRSSVESVPHFEELFALAGLIILGDGAIRLSIGAYRYRANRGLINATV